MNSIKLNTTFILLVFSTSLLAQTRNELYRPEFHYSPAENWMNDPNGLVYYNGIYHMFYQYNSLGDQWNNMSWGHATSTDLINWKEQAIALPYTNGIMAFSGSAVVDWENTSGFGKNDQPALVAIYTGFNPATGVQDQRLAYSNDEGFTWTDYEFNPVIDINSSEFRDPKVIWHAPTNSWIMLVALGSEGKIRFYRSDNLKTWEFLQDFGPEGNRAGAWECPDLFSLLVDGNQSNMKWVLVLSVAPGSAQYFIGEFDGLYFEWDNSPTPTGILIDDFESGNYSNWTVAGSAFGQSPASGTLPDQQEVTGYLGNGFINSYNYGDITQGKLISNDFILEKDYISFLIGGGCHPTGTYIKLILNNTNEVLYKATGRNDEFLEWNSWNVESYVGQSARLEIVDSITGGWGHINVDHIIQTDDPVTNQSTGPIDFGKDFYALQSFSDIPAFDGRRIWLAWMNNWSYASDIPTSPWRGIMSIPRELELITINSQIYLVQKPVSELKALRADSLCFKNETLNNIQNYLEGVDFKTFEIQGTLTDLNSGGFDLMIKKGSDQETRISFDTDNYKVRFDRSNSGHLSDIQVYSDVQIAQLNMENENLEFNLIVDHCSVELFINGGQKVFSNQVFPDSTSNGIELSAYNSSLEFKEIKIYNYSQPDTTSINTPTASWRFDFQIYPNPLVNAEETIIKLQGQQNGPLNFSVYSVLGQKLFQAATHNKRFTISREIFPSSGIYFIEIEMQGSSITKKLIVR